MAMTDPFKRHRPDPTARRLSKLPFHARITENPNGFKEGANAFLQRREPPWRNR